MQYDNDGVSTGISSVQDSSPESSAVDTNSTTAASQDITKNLKAEMNRKFSRINEQLSTLVEFVNQQRQPAPVEKTEIQEDGGVRVTVARELAANAHREQFTNAVNSFPELNQKSDDYDPEFYSAVDRYYTAFTKADPTDREAFTNALELAAAKFGKTERVLKDKLLKDEARRSRIIAEGGAVPRETKKEKEPQLNLKALQSKLGIDPEKLKKRMKQESGE